MSLARLKSLSIPRLVGMTLFVSAVFAAPLMWAINYFFPSHGTWLGNLTENFYIATIVGFVLFHPLFFGFFGFLYFLKGVPRRYGYFSTFVLIPILFFNTFWLLLGGEWLRYFFFLAVALIFAAIGTTVGLVVAWLYEKMVSHPQST